MLLKTKIIKLSVSFQISVILTLIKSVNYCNNYLYYQVLYHGAKGAPNQIIPEYMSELETFWIGFWRRPKLPVIANRIRINTSFLKIYIVKLRII